MVPSSSSASHKYEGSVSLSFKVSRISSHKNCRSAVCQVLIGSSPYYTYLRSCAPLLYQECFHIDVSRLARRTLRWIMLMAAVEWQASIRDGNGFRPTVSQLSQSHSFARSGERNDHLSSTTIEGDYRLFLARCSDGVPMVCSWDPWCRPAHCACQSRLPSQNHWT